MTSAPDRTTVESMQTMVPAGADKIWAEDSGGDGPVLLFLHEGVGDARMWDPVWPSLTPSHRAIRYDVRAYGRSPAATENYSLLGDAQAVLDHYAVSSAHIVGCSMGGGTAIELALAEPDRVVRLALAAEGPGWDGYFLWDRILALPGMAAADPWAIMAAVAQATARVRLGMPHRSPAGPECSPGRRLPSTGSPEAVWS